MPADGTDTGSAGKGNYSSLTDVCTIYAYVELEVVEQPSIGKISRPSLIVGIAFFGNLAPSHHEAPTQVFFEWDASVRRGCVILT